MTLMSLLRRQEPSGFVLNTQKALDPCLRRDDDKFASHGLTMTPTKIKLHKQSKTLELHFGTEQFELSAEFLRVHSPSAEVKGHGPGQEVLQTGKKHVGFSGAEAVGNYALKLIFDDGHDSGIFSWDYLYDLGQNQETYWNAYLEKLSHAGQSRDANESIVKFIQ
jgi:DUF971 family protein